MPDGATLELVATIAPYYVGTNGNPPNPTHYFSIDGSNITLDMATQSGQPNIMRMPDGSRYEFGFDANTQRQTVQHFDWHGNVMSYQYNPTSEQGEWLDTMGRTIPVPKVPRDPNNPGSSAPGDVDYFVPSLPGQPMKYTFKWRRLADSFADTNYTVQKLSDLFAEVWSSMGLINHNPVVLQEIVLSNGQSYRFGYNTYGEIEKITYPSGGTERFRYEAIPQFSYPVKLSTNIMQGQGNRGVVEHWISPDNNPANEMHWQYAVPHDNFLRATAPYHIETIAPDQSRTERYFYTQRSGEAASQPPRLPSQLAGKVYEERSYSTTGALVSRTLTKWTGADGTTTFGSPSPYINSYAKVERTTGIVIENGQALAQSQTFSYSYDNYLNVTRQTSFDYVGLTTTAAATSTIDNIALGTPLKTSQTTYKTESVYKDQQMVSLPQTTTLRDGDENGTVIATSETVYDEPGYGILAGGTLTGNAAATWSDPNNLYRANPTTSKVWNSDQNSWIETHAQFDKFGNLRKAWDASNDPSRYAETEYSDAFQCAYPTKVITPAPDPSNTTGTSDSSFATTIYDLNTGLPLTVTDEFEQTTRTEYNDLLLRPTRTFAINFTAPETQIEYGDTVGNLFVKVRKQIDGTNWDEATTFADGLGRTIKTQAKDSQGDVFTETQYDEMGRVKQATNPYRNGEQKLWSKPRYDELGRAVESFAPAPDGQTGASLGITSYAISTTPIVGTAVTAMDASGRKSRSITNALGQLVRVDEATATGGTETADLGALTNPNQPTYYTYNAQGKMVKVQQGGQSRYFKYDSLGRLIRVRQPEQEVNPALNVADSYNTSGQWTAAFSYDVFGNILTATDAKGVTITNTYDKASRVKTRSYSDATPPVSYFYDGKGLTQQQSPNFAKGKLTKVSSSVSETRNTTFDNLGRLLSSSQITDGQTYTSSYQYNLSGALVQETYPSGRVVKNEFESDGDLKRIFGNALNQTEKTYANGFVYTADGKIQRLRLGNGRWESAKFNERLQVTELALGASNGDGGLWKLAYEYGELNTDGTTVNTAKNTGNIAKQTVSFNGLAQPFVQTYKYDALYRLTEAKETNNGNQTWKQTFGYDIYGNRNVYQKFIGTTPVTLDNKTFPQIDATTNRILTSQGYVFDKNGNLTLDAENRSFIFNGDNKQTEVKDVNNQPIGKYFYDGEGKRVKKEIYAGGQVLETTIFVYSAGKLVAEYSTAAPPTNPTTSYTATDQLGSPRVITNAFGQVTSRRDFHPFGEELLPDTVYRKTSDKYGAADSVRQRFTGYQKDTETGLDFAEARYYNNQHARFTAVDPLLASGKSANPQTFNRYVYVGNSPLIITDPTGLFGDYYDRNGSYLGTDGKNDRKVYFADLVQRRGNQVDLTNWRRTTLEMVGQARSSYEALQRFYEQTPAGNDFESNAVRALGTSVTNGVSDAATGIVNGVGNTFIHGANALTQPFGPAGSQLGISNPFAIPELSCGNARICSYSSASETGTNLGLAFAGGVFAKPSGNPFAAPEVEALGASRCFVAGTLIHTENGLVPIEEIKAGDKVLSYNEGGRQVEYQTVLRTFVNHSSNLFEVRIEGQSEPITVTNGHPFYVHRARSNLSADEGEWINSDKLEAGDSVLRPDGNWIKVLAINHAFGEAAVYNFEVEQNHDYFVGSSGVLVHNQTECGGSFFDGTKYTNKVLGDMSKGDLHSFPESVKAFESSGTVRSVTGGDGVTRQMLEIPGGYKNYDNGVFQFMKEANGDINHRFFKGF